jgi:hypothetical protein
VHHYSLAACVLCSFDPNELILPGELRFQKPAVDSIRMGFSQASFDLNPYRLFTHEDVQRRYGVRVVFDPWEASTGVSILFTCEPVSMWRQELHSVPICIQQEHLNLHLKDVRRLVVAGKDGSAARFDVKHGFNAQEVLVSYVSRRLERRRV